MRPGWSEFPVFRNCLEEVFSETELPVLPYLGNPPHPGPSDEEGLPDPPLLQDAVVASAFTTKMLFREEGEVVLGYRVQIPAL